MTMTRAQAASAIRGILGSLDDKQLPKPSIEHRDGQTIAWFGSTGYHLGSATRNGDRRPENYRDDAVRSALEHEAVYRLDSSAPHTDSPKGPTMPEVCGYTITDRDGIEEPCDQPATGWRWYQDVEHEDCLAPACVIHENTGGGRLHAAEDRLARAHRMLLDLGDLLDGLGWSLHTSACLGEPGCDLCRLLEVLSGTGELLDHCDATVTPDWADQWQPARDVVQARLQGFTEGYDLAVATMRAQIEQRNYIGATRQECPPEGQRGGQDRTAPRGANPKPLLSGNAENRPCAGSGGPVDASHLVRGTENRGVWGYWVARLDGQIPAAAEPFQTLHEARQYAEGRPLRVIAICEAEDD